MTNIGHRYAGLWAFLGAAAAAPIAYLSVAPCGLACGGCPLGGACFIPTPLVLGAIVVSKFVQRRSAANDLGQNATVSDDDDFPDMDTE